MRGKLSRTDRSPTYYPIPHILMRRPSWRLSRVSPVLPILRLFCVEGLIGRNCRLDVVLRRVAESPNRNVRSIVQNRSPLVQIIWQPAGVSTGPRLYGRPETILYGKGSLHDDRGEAGGWEAPQKHYCAV